MNTNRRFGWAMIIAVAVLASAAIIFPSALAKPAGEKSPEAVAESFYAWYLEAYGNPAEGTIESPLVTKVYRQSDFLTTSFIGHVDDVLAGFETQSGYDPFLCAQDLPAEMKADGTFLHGELASVIMRSGFPGHVLTVDLQEIDGTWKISNITCGFSPEGTAKAFYTWYLAYIGDPAVEEVRNPLVDRAYRESGFLTASFIQELDEQVAAGLSADPILLAQDVPLDFSVDPGVEEGIAIVHLQFGNENTRHLKVQMAEEMGGWKISGIEQAR